MTELKFKMLFFLLAVSSAVFALGSGAQAQLLTQDKMETVVRQHVLAEGPWKAENIEVRVSPFQPISLPSGSPSYRVLKPNKGVTPGLQNLLVAAEVGGKEVARLWIKAELRVFDEVLVTSYPLAHHEIVSADKVRLERRDISSVMARPFSRVEEVEGLQTTRAIEVNEVVTQKSLERPTLMRRGSPIVLVYESGSLRVETPGLAEEGGKAGDFIQVKNPTSGKVMRGLVVDGRTVRVN
jgi:flagellar basal body P-ring formation protein FlgA